MLAAEIIEWASPLHNFGELLPSIIRPEHLNTSEITIEENEIPEKLFRRAHSDSNAALCTLYNPCHFYFHFLFMFLSGLKYMCGN